MTEINNKYQNGKIYKIIYLKEPNKIYIGSTIRTLEKRFLQHCSQAKINDENNKITIYNFHMFLNKHSNDDFNIELIENYPCNSKNELEDREHIIMTEYLQENFELFNINVNHKFKEGCHGHLYNKTEEEHNTFKYGSLKFNKNNNKWVFQYQKNNTTKSKKWSSNKYGDDNAKKLAELYQIKIYPKCTTIYDYNITYDEFYNNLINEINVQKEEDNKNKPLFPESGQIYKKNRKNGTLNYFEFLYTDDNNKNHSKSFCIDKYGEDNAKILAELYRKKIFPDYDINQNILDEYITYEQYLEILDNNLIKEKNNITQFIGLYTKKCDTNNYNYLQFKWKENGNIYTKVFNIDLFGENNANILAELFRKKLFPDYQNELINNLNYDFDEYEKMLQITNSDKTSIFGNIYRIDGVKKFWIFKWINSEDNKTYTKYFNIEKYGEDDAKLLAELYKHKIYPLYTNDLNCSFEEYEEILINKLNNMYNGLGFGQLNKYTKKNYTCWKLTWKENDKRKSKDFNIDKYGEDNALILAELYRKKIFPNYNHNKDINNLNTNYEDYLETLI